MNAIENLVSQPSVLVIDDEYIHGDVATHVLRKAGWRVIGHECDPNEGIAMFRKHGPDIVLLDICFPFGVRGFEILDKMRLLADRHGLPSPFAVFLTSYGDLETQSEAHSIRGSIYLEKPLSDDDLIRGLESATERLSTWRSEVKGLRTLNATDDPEEEASLLNPKRAEQALAKLRQLPKNSEPDSLGTVWSDKLNAERFYLIEKEFEAGLDQNEHLRLSEIERQMDRWLDETSGLDDFKAKALLTELRNLPNK